MPSKRSLRIILLIACACGLSLALLLARFWKSSSTEPPYDYIALKTECEATLQRSPHEADIIALFKSKKLRFKRQTAPFDSFFTDILQSNGISAAAIPQASSCLYFENLSIRKESFSLASHQACGYFIFDPAGNLLDHHISSGAYGL